MTTNLLGILQNGGTFFREHDFCAFTCSYVKEEDNEEEEEKEKEEEK